MISLMARGGDRDGENTPRPSTSIDEGNESAAPAAGITQIDDDIGPPPPLEMQDFVPDDAQIEKKKRAMRVEEIKDDVGPHNPFSDGASSAKGKAKGAVEQISDDAGPADMFRDDFDEEKEEEREVDPFDFAEFEGAEVQRQGRDTIVIPTQEDIESGPEPLAITRTPANVRRRDGGAPVARQEPQSTTVLEQDQSDSIPHIPEAFLVEEEDEVIAGYAEPLLPWWKQRRTRLLMAMVLLLIAIMAIVLGVVLSRPDPPPQTTLVALTPSPTASPAPSLQRSIQPSTSSLPSSSPTACSRTISTKRQTLEMPLDSLVSPKAAIDGRRMVVVAKDSNLDFVYIMFYSLLENDVWTLLDKYYIEEYEEFESKWGRDLKDYVVAISDDTALVGIPTKNVDGASKGMTGTVFIYEQGVDGVWEEYKDGPLTSESKDWSVDDSGKDNLHFRFGLAVGIDGDFVCATATEYKYASGLEISFIDKDIADYVYVFQRVRGRWKRIQRIDYGFTRSPVTRANCNIQGNTLAVGPGIYLYDWNTRQFRLQDELPQEFTSFSGDYIASREYHRQRPWDKIDDEKIEIFIYHRLEANGRFILLQRLQASDYGHGFESALALDKDMLVVGGNSTSSNTTCIFTMRDGFFDEGRSSHAVEQSYQGFGVSERSVIATSDQEVHTFNIEDCTQSIPTQSPTASFAPSTTSLPTERATPRPTNPLTASFLSYEPTPAPMARPSDSPSRSLTPTKSGEPTMAPSQSLSPTDMCYWVDIALVFDKYPEETSWSLSTIDNASEDQETFSFGPASESDTAVSESMCLSEGRYLFTIIDWSGICCSDGQGSYTITSYGDVIAQGGEFRREQSVVFDLPFTEVQPFMPNLDPNQSPSTTSPTANPIEQPTFRTRPPETTWPTSDQPSSASPLSQQRACLTQQQCESQQKRTEFIEFCAGSFPDYGCFQKGDTLYWGTGGSVEQMTETSLGGSKKRVWCNPLE